MDKVKFAVFGLVKWKGQKLANGVDGVFETDDEKTITRLRQMGFSEIQAAKIQEDKQTVAKQVANKKPTPTKKGKKK